MPQDPMARANSTAVANGIAAAAEQAANAQMMQQQQQQQQNGQVRHTLTVTEWTRSKMFNKWQICIFFIVSVLCTGAVLRRRPAQLAAER